MGHFKISFFRMLRKFSRLIPRGAKTILFWKIVRASSEPWTTRISWFDDSGQDRGQESGPGIMFDILSLLRALPQFEQVPVMSRYNTYRRRKIPHTHNKNQTNEVDRTHS